jgi:hypothetical protein
MFAGSGLGADIGGLAGSFRNGFVIEGFREEGKLNSWPRHVEENSHVGCHLKANDGMTGVFLLEYRAVCNEGLPDRSFMRPRPVSRNRRQAANQNQGNREGDETWDENKCSGTAFKYHVILQVHMLHEAEPINVMTIHQSMDTPFAHPEDPYVKTPSSVHSSNHYAMTSRPHDEERSRHQPSDI